MSKNNPVWAFFGTEGISIIVLDELKARGFIPRLIVTVEDKPKGRNLEMSSPEVKTWAENEDVDFIQLKSLKDKESEEIIRSSAPEGFDLFVVASYGKMIPQNILDIPKHKTLNVHPSLLPKLRGPSPIQSAILEENETGVTIMQVDAEMDHGPVISQKKLEIEWPPYAEQLENTLGKLGGEMLAEIIPSWISGKVKETPQNENLATFCKKIEKSDGEIKLEDKAEKNLRKIRAYSVWPGAYFFYDDGKSKTRIIIKKAHVSGGKLVLDRILPEGRKEMDWQSFLNGKNKPNL